MSAETSEELRPQGEQEYEWGFGAGPNGMREVSLCKGFTFNPLVSVGAAVVLWAFVIKVSVDSEQSLADFGTAQSWVTDTFTWLYIGSQDYWLAFLVPLCYYYGHVKLGQDDEEPEYSDLSYFAMVFCAGVAIGLIFYGASEPLWHMDGTNRYQGYRNQNEEAQAAINVTIFHWGLQAWVVYALTAVTMGFLSYRKGLPLCFRTTLAPLFGKAIWGWMGDLIDIVTIVTIVAGLCTSLGLGASQIVAGMQRLEWLDSDMNADEIANAGCWVTAVITLFATLSVVCGLNYGIKTLSQTAFVLGNFLLCCVFFLDAPWFLLNVICQSLGYHLQNFLEISFYTDAFAQLGKGQGAPNDGKGANPQWMNWWTIFYWGWWIAWAPFVGTFMARISRGRTIRQVVGYTLTVPFAYALVWFCVFGSAAIRMDRRATFLKDMGLKIHNNTDHFLFTGGNYRPAAAGKCYTVPESLDHPDFAKEGSYVTNVKVSPVCTFSWGDDKGYWFDLMNQYHGMGTFLSVVSVITTALYFVTSSDSGSLVVDLIAANGREAHVIQRVFWAISEGAVAIALLKAGGQGSLKALQALSICAGLPFTIFLMYMCTALWRALKIDQGHMKPRGERCDWALPLYGGIFDVPETVLTCGRAPLPKFNQIKLFFLGLFCPPLLLWKTLRKLSSRHAEAKASGLSKVEPTTAIQDALMVAGCGIAFLAFIILHILTGAQVENASGLFGLGWTAYVAFTVILAVVRHTLRLTYKIEGNGIEDFFACLFIYPQILAQMVEQVEVEVDLKGPKVTDAVKQVSEGEAQKGHVNI